MQKTHNKIRVLRAIWIVALVITVAIVAYGIIQYPLQYTADGKSMMIGNTNIQSIDIFEVFIRFPLRAVIYWSSALFNFNWIIGITIATILIKLLVAPFGIKSTLATRENSKISEETALLKKYYEKTKKPKQQMQADQMLLQKRFGINMFASCAPMFFQMLFLIIFYQAIMYTPAITSDTIWGINLGYPSSSNILGTLFSINGVIAVLAAVATYFVSVTTTMLQDASMQNEQTQQMNSMMKWMMPAMIMFFGLTMSPAIIIYWVVSNTFTIAQNLVIAAVYKD